MALKKYAVGGLQGCFISVTGVAFEERAKICAMVQELGGTYSPDLNPQCSHLIFEDLERERTSSQQQNAAPPIKVTYALRWNIPVVTKDWIYACYSQKMLLDESDYSAVSGVGFDEESFTQPTENLPLKIGDIQEDTPPFLHGCHIYLNGDSISSQKLAVLKRLVLASGGVRYADLGTPNLTHIVIHNQLLPNNLKMFLDQQGEDSQVKLVHDNWLFDSFRERRRLPEEDYEVIKKPKTKIEAPPVAQKWKSAFTSTSTAAFANSNPNSSLIINNNNSSFLNANPNISYTTPRTSIAGKEDFLSGTPNILESSAKILKGKSIYLGGMPASSSKIHKLVAKAKRAEMKVVENEIEADWCITGVLITQEQLRKLTLHRSPADLRNEIWFEAALDSKSHLPSMTFAHPVPCVSYPLPKWNKFVMSQSGFTGAEREFYAELIKSTGAQYTDSLSKTNTHLVIDEPRSGVKYNFAKKWKIECIDLAWFKNNLLVQDQHPREIKDRRDSKDENVYSQNSQNAPLTKSQSQPQSQLSQGKLSFQSVKTITEPVNNNSESLLLFKGLIFASSQRLWHRRDELSSLVESLGGVFLWSFDRNCTHYLHQGKLADEAFKEFKQARQWGKHIISPFWVVKCKETGRRLDELQFPHTYKENDDTVTLNSQIIEPETESQTPQPQAKDRHSQPQSQTNINWDAIMEGREADAFILKPGSKNYFNIDAHPAFQEQAGTYNNRSETQTPKVIKPSQTAASKFKVVFSGYSSGDKAELVKLINTSRPDLKVIPDDEIIKWDPKTTILICNSLNFTEKIFSACATGCWILKKEYLNESESPGNLEKYEIGPAWNANERDMAIGKAPKYWRQRLSGSGSIDELRPFHGWKCTLFVESSRQVLFESVLRNGGAQIYSTDQLLANVALFKEISHFFCSNLKAVPEDARRHLRNDQIFATKHITNTIFRLND